MVWNLVIPALASLYGSYSASKGQKSANQAQLNQYNTALGAQTGQNKMNEALRSLATRQAQLGLGDVKRGYASALSSVSGIGAEGYRAIAETGQMNRSLAVQQSYGRGLYNTTAGQSLEAQTAYQTQRAQAGLAERLASLRATLHAQQGSALAGARANIGNALSGQAQGGAADTGALVELLGSRRDVFDPGIYGQLGQTAALLSYFLMNQGGGGNAGTQPLTYQQGVGATSAANFGASSMQNILLGLS
jgi:hypothetical protein